MANNMLNNIFFNLDLLRIHMSFDSLVFLTFK